MTEIGTGVPPLYFEADERLALYVSRNVATDGLEFFFRIRQPMPDGPSKKITVTSFTIREAVSGEPLRPAFVLSEEQGQVLMNALWDAGVRPRDVGGAGELAALRLHLRDMRTLAATQIGVRLVDERGEDLR